MDAAGNIYVADTLNHTIRKITPNGLVTTVAGSPEQTGDADGAGHNARFHYPNGVAVDAAGHIYVTDAVNHVIRKIDPIGNVTTFAGAAGQWGHLDGVGGAARFGYLHDIVVDKNGTLYVADPNHSVIRKITPDATVSTLSTVSSDPPSGLAIDAMGNLYVAYRQSGIVQKIAPDGTITSATGYAFTYLVDVASDMSGALYISQSRVVNKFTASDGLTTLAGVFGEYGTDDGVGSAARFFNAGGLSVDIDGTLYVSDHHTIRKVATDGTVTTLAGAAAEIGHKDGAGASARFRSPVAIATDPRGYSYVADSSSHCIRKITPSGFVTTLAGDPSNPGYTDGVGSQARFNFPNGVAVDQDANVYVADSWNHTIRKITPDGEVTTLAGLAGVPGSVDGTGTKARFSSPQGIALDHPGNLYVADLGNRWIRKISLNGNVTTLNLGVPNPLLQPGAVAVDATGNVFIADSGHHTIQRLTPTSSFSTFAGSPGQQGSADGTGSEARFSIPVGLATDSLGNIYVTDMGNDTIRRITPNGVVTTVAGTPGRLGRADGTGENVRFTDPTGIAVDAAGNLYVADSGNRSIRRGTLTNPDSPLITAHPESPAPHAGDTVTMSVQASGTGTLSYQWQFNGNNIHGATGASYVLPSVQSFHSGNYTVTVTNENGSSLSGIATLSVRPTPSSSSRLLNLSTRGLAQAGDNVLIPGFVIQGAQPKRLLIRTVGPTLRLKPFSISRPTAPDPRMTLKRLNTSQTPAAWVDVAASDDWIDQANADEIVTTGAELYAFGLKDDREAALLVDLQPGQYTVIAGDKNDESGIAVVEVYDADPDELKNGSRLINISNRGFCGVGDEVMIPGFWVSNEGPKTFLIRVVGPRLATNPFNVTGTMADPKLTIFSGQNAILENDNWGDNPDAAHTAEIAQQVYAFPLQSGSKDAAFVVTLPPGGYTVVGSSATDGGTGIVLVEVYAVP